jgi:Fe-S cluster biogenesis protein NfuA
MEQAIGSTDVRELPARIESLLDELTASGDANISACADELVASMLALYGSGLARIVELVGNDPAGDAVVRRLADDALVGNLLLLHDLHPDDVSTRIQHALDRVRPYLGSHAGGIEYLGVDEDGVAHLRLEGSCDGCAGSAATVNNAVERAVLDAAPEVIRIEVEGVIEQTPRTSQLLQIGMRCPDGLVEAVGA